MADRNSAFAAWRRGVISDDDLKQVVNDLQMVVDVLYAMEDRGIALRGLRQELDSALRMYEARKRDRKSA